MTTDDQPAHVEEQSVEPVSEPPPLEEEHYEEPTQPEVTEEHVPEANEGEFQLLILKSYPVFCLLVTMMRPSQEQLRD